MTLTLNNGKTVELTIDGNTDYIKERYGEDIVIDYATDENGNRYNVFWHIGNNETDKIDWENPTYVYMQDSYRLNGELVYDNIE